MSLPSMPSIVQIAVGAAMTSLSDPADASAGFGVTVADVIVSTSLLCHQRYAAYRCCPYHWAATFRSAPLSSSRRCAGLFRETGETSPRGAVEALVDRWFRAAPIQSGVDLPEPLLNRPALGESEKLHAALRDHVVGQRRWQELSNNESTFYRYRRAAI